MPDYTYKCLSLNADILEIISILKTILLIVQIGVLVALIIWLMIDVIKTIVNSEVDTSKLFKMMTKRIMAVAMIFLVPLIIDTVLGLVETNQKYIAYYNCAEDDIIDEIYMNDATEAVTKLMYNPNYLNYVEAKRAVNKIKNDNEFKDKAKFLTIIEEFEQGMVGEEVPDIYEGLAQSNNPGEPIEIEVVGDSLSQAQQNEIMNSLPDNISEERKRIVSLSLLSVGQIPYYWGGVASYKFFDGNNFGSQVLGDNNGRTKKGLDCSHFVDWVYWSTVDNNLGNGSTITLLENSYDIDSSELLPGDLVFDNASRSSKNHVGIYIGRNEDGKMLVVHETGGGVNNVVLNTSYPWNVYRRVKSDIVDLD